ncbi:hypothetical protein TNCV_1626111 [Trichonephila clavipes]|nr:hypothetical protein TNCV_1626111 [Trichonephila clavipes]
MLRHERTFQLSISLTCIAAPFPAIFVAGLELRDMPTMIRYLDAPGAPATGPYRPQVVGQRKRESATQYPLTSIKLLEIQGILEKY